MGGFLCFWMLSGETALENLSILILSLVEKVGWRNCACLQHLVLLKTLSHLLPCDHLKVAQECDEMGR